MKEEMIKNLNKFLSGFTEEERSEIRTEFRKNRPPSKKYKDFGEMLDEMHRPITVVPDPETKTWGKTDIYQIDPD